jgi:hypothetical protein
MIHEAERRRDNKSKRCFPIEELVAREAFADLIEYPERVFREETVTLQEFNPELHELLNIIESTLPAATVAAFRIGALTTHRMLRKQGEVPEVSIDNISAAMGSILEEHSDKEMPEFLIRIREDLTIEDPELGKTISVVAAFANSESHQDFVFYGAYSVFNTIKQTWQTKDFSEHFPHE